MRTTVAIDNSILEAAKQRARERGQTLGQVIEHALRRELAAQSVADETVLLPLYEGVGGRLPGVDLRSNRAVAELLDRGSEYREMR